MANFTIETVDTWEQVEPIAAAWRRLHAAMGSDCLFTSYEWISVWWKHFSQARRLCVLVVRDGAEICGIAPLCQRRMGGNPLPLWKLEFLGTGQSDWSEFLIPNPTPELVEALVTHMCALRPRWGVMDLRQFPAQARGRAEFESTCGRQGLNVCILDDARCPSIQLTGTWEAFLERQFSGKTRWQLRKKVKQAAGRGAVHVRTVTEAGEMPAALDVIEKIRGRAYYDGKRRYTLFERPLTRAFYRDVTPLLAQHKWMHISILELDGKPVAYRYGFRLNGRHYDYFHDFDQVAGDAAPGMVLMMEVVASCFREGLREFNFLRGDEAYKAQWATDCANFVRFMVFPPALRGRLLRLAYAAQQRRSRTSSATAELPNK